MAKAKSELSVPAEYEGFVLRGYWIASTSERIRSVRYDAENRRLYVHFAGKGGASAGGGSYYPVKPEQALEFAQGGCRNTWIWDNLRVRGTKHGHVVSYRPETF